MNLLWIAIAGGLGTAARYGVTRWIAEDFLPWGTLTVNMFGSLVLGLVLTQAARVEPGATPPLVAIVSIGFCGGFTTYSSFNWEMLRLAQSVGVGRSVLYVGVTLMGCALAGWIGAVVSKAWGG